MPRTCLLYYSNAIRLQPAYMKMDIHVATIAFAERVSSNRCSVSMAMTAHIRANTPNMIRLMIIIYHHLLLNTLSLIRFKTFGVAFFYFCYQLFIFFCLQFILYGIKSNSWFILFDPYCYNW